MGKAPHIAGGALSNGKLKLADATAADVLAGKKFYSGDKTLKTGTLKGYVTSPSLSSSAARGETATSGNGKPYHNAGFTRYFVQCTSASVSKLSSNKVRVTLVVRGGWAVYGDSDQYAQATWTFDVTLD